MGSLDSSHGPTQVTKIILELIHTKEVVPGKTRHNKVTPHILKRKTIFLYIR